MKKSKIVKKEGRIIKLRMFFYQNFNFRSYLVSLKTAWFTKKHI